MDTTLKDDNDPGDQGNFKLPINRKMSIAILKIPKPMIIIGNQITSISSNCTCNGNETCIYCFNTGNGVYINNNSSLIKFDNFNKSDLSIKNKETQVNLNDKLPDKPVKFTCKTNKLQKIPKNKSNKKNKIHRNKYLKLTRKLTKIKKMNLNNNRDTTKDTTRDIGRDSTTSSNKDKNDINKNHIESKNIDKCVDTCDINKSINSQLDNFNILDHLNEVESLLNIERKRRYNEIRRDYSILRDKLEEKFHLVISSCNQRLLHLNSSYLNTLSSIKSNISTLKLPKLKHIKQQIDLL